MSHIFSLEDLARSKVHLQFLSPDQPPNIQWRSLTRPISVAAFAKSLSIRVNLSTVDGRPSLSMFLIEDPDAQEDFCFGSNYQEEEPSQADMNGSTNAMGLYHPSPVGVFGNNFLPSYRGSSVGSLTDSQDGRILSTPELESSSRLSSPSSSIFSTPPLSSNCDSNLYSAEFLSSNPHTPSSEIRQPLESPGEESSASSFLMGFDLLFQNGAQIKGPTPELPRSEFSNMAGSMMHRPVANTRGQIRSQTSDFSTIDAPCEDDWPKRARRINSTRRAGRGRSDTPQARGVRKRVKCSICDETFSRRHDMMRHESAQHGKVQEWTCQACGKFFANESMLAIHDCRKCPR